jgi:RHS repeat-associated protein
MDAYDQANRLTGATSGGVTSSYSLDGDGKRVSRTNSGTTNSYVYDTTGGLPMLLDDGPRKYVYGPSGVLYEVDKASGRPYVLHTDAQDSVRVITDRLANAVETYSNDAYGNPLITLSASAPNNVASQPLQYTAEPRDPETGGLYLRARIYDPTIGRFAQHDPLGVTSCNLHSPMKLSRYGYVEANPVVLADPTGMSSCLTTTCIPGGPCFTETTDCGDNSIDITSATGKGGAWEDACHHESLQCQNCCQLWLGRGGSRASRERRYDDCKKQCVTCEGFCNEQGPDPSLRCSAVGPHNYECFHWPMYAAPEPGKEPPVDTGTVVALRR